MKGFEKGLAKIAEETAKLWNNLSLACPGDLSESTKKKPNRSYLHSTTHVLNHMAAAQRARGLRTLRRGSNVGESKMHHSSCEMATITSLPHSICIANSQLTGG